MEDRYDWKDVAQRAMGMWPDILESYGIPFKPRQKNLPCPVCGGNDRAHYKMQDGKVLLHCRQAAGHDPNMWGDEILLELAFGGDFSSMVNEIGRYVGAMPEERRQHVKRKATIAEASSGTHKTETLKEYAEKVMARTSIVPRCPMTVRLGVSPSPLHVLKDGRVVVPMYIDGMLLDALVIGDDREHNSVSLLYHVPGPGFARQARYTIGDEGESSYVVIATDYFDAWHLHHQSRRESACHVYADWLSALVDAGRIRKAGKRVLVACSIFDERLEDAINLLASLGRSAKLISPVAGWHHFVEVQGPTPKEKQWPYLINAPQANRIWNEIHAR